ETVGDYVRIKTQDGTFLIHSTIKSIDDKIQDPRFLKVHRSYIVNLQHIIEIAESTLLIEQFQIPISRANRPVLINRLNIL
ncbi:MAG: LytR/AlgR family response regulator transcription factor, partial [Haliscomenobacter sp.]